jgi:ribonucleotide monophosphatase NagD (HAD superfamily)
VGEVVQQCTGVLLDQFGVLHDGKVPYPHAVAAVKRLADAGKQIIVLSNSSRRSGGTIGKLVKMGFKEEWFTGRFSRLRPGAAALCGT